MIIVAAFFLILITIWMFLIKVGEIFGVRKCSIVKFEVPKTSEIYDPSNYTNPLNEFNGIDS